MPAGLGVRGAVNPGPSGGAACSRAAGMEAVPGSEALGDSAVGGSAAGTLGQAPGSIASAERFGPGGS